MYEPYDVTENITRGLVHPPQCPWHCPPGNWRTFLLSVKFHNFLSLLYRKICWCFKQISASQFQSSAILNNWIESSEKKKGEEIHLGTLEESLSQVVFVEAWQNNISGFATRLLKLRNRGGFRSFTFTQDSTYVYSGSIMWPKLIFYGYGAVFCRVFLFVFRTHEYNIIESDVRKMRIECLTSLPIHWAFCVLLSYLEQSR